MVGFLSQVCVDVGDGSNRRDDAVSYCSDIHKFLDDGR